MLEMWEHDMKYGKRFKNYQDLLAEVGEEMAKSVIVQIKDRPLYNHAVYTDTEGAVSDLMLPYRLDGKDRSWGWGPKPADLKEYQWGV